MFWLRIYTRLMTNSKSFPAKYTKAAIHTAKFSTSNDLRYMVYSCVHFTGICTKNLLFNHKVFIHECHRCDNHLIINTTQNWITVILSSFEFQSLQIYRIIGGDGNQSSVTTGNFATSVCIWKLTASAQNACLHNFNRLVPDCTAVQSLLYTTVAQFYNFLVTLEVVKQDHVHVRISVLLVVH